MEKSERVRIFNEIVSGESNLEKIMFGRYTAKENDDWPEEVPF